MYIFVFLPQEKQGDSEDEIESDDGGDEYEEDPTVPTTRPPDATSNHTNQNKQPRNMTSTPVVGKMPAFSIMSSNVISPQQGSLTGYNDALTNQERENVFVKKSSSKLLSIDDNDDKNGSTHSSATQQDDDTQREKFSLNPFSFSMGTKPSGAPQKFFYSRNKPSFKVSSFISSSPLIPCGSSSSFYPGRTSYGGASYLQDRNVKRQKMSPVAANVPMKRANIKPKPISSLRGAVTSDTARKILGALERMTSPVRDASKLPNSPSSVLFNPLKRKTNDTFQFAKKPTMNPPPISSLSTPRTVNIQLRDNASKPFRFGSGDVRPSAPVTTFKSRGLPTSFSPEDDFKAGGKMKRQRQSAHYSAASQLADEEPINTLPEIQSAAPLVVSSLPNFDFGVAVVSQSKEAEPKVSVVEIRQEVTVKNKSFEGFAFSQPEVISEGAKKKVSDVPKSSFQFSAPARKEAEKATEKATNKAVKISKNSQVIDLTNADKDAHFVQPNASKSGSGKVLNMWGKISSEWECGSCFLMNGDGNVACVACQAAKPLKNNATKEPAEQSKLTFVNSKASKPSAGKMLANKLKTDENMWECDSCMLGNKPEIKECIACGSKNPAIRTGNTVSNLFQKKFSAPPDSWECSVCCLRNDGDKKECVACGFKNKSNNSKMQPTNQSSILQNMFGASERWECETCMLNNKPDVSECISCLSPRPGKTTAAVSKSAPFSFGTSSASSNIKFGTSEPSSSIKFGTSEPNSGVKFGTSEPSNSIKFGTSEPSNSIKFGTSEPSSIIKFGTSEPNSSIKFGTSEPRSSIKFGTSEPSSSIKFGTSEPSSSIKFGTSEPSGSTKPAAENANNTVKSAASGDTSKKSGSIFGTDGSVGFNFSKNDKTGGTGFRTKESTADVNIGSSDAKGFVFGNSPSTSSFKMGASVGFSFGAPNDLKDSESIPAASASKREENNNLSDGKAAVTSKDQGASTWSFSAPKEGGISTEKGGIKSIAEAAQAGLLKVPEMDKEGNDAPKFSFGAPVVNGPVKINSNALNSMDFDSKSGNTSQVEKTSSLSMPVGTSFKFASESSSADSKLFSSGGSGTSETIPPKAMFSFAAPSSSSQPKISTKENLSFGSSNSFAFAPAENVLAPSTTENKETTSFEKTNPSTSAGIPGKFSFGQGATQVIFGSSTLQNENNQGIPSTSFQSNSVSIKSSVFGQNSERRQQNTGESSKKASTTVDSLFSSAEPSANIFGGGLFQNPSSTPSNSFTPSNALSGGKFSFGANSTNVPNLFGNQAVQNAPASAPTGFNFTAAPTTSAEKPQGNNVNSFDFGAPAENRGITPFSFSNASSNSSAFGSGGSGRFNFGSTDSPTPLFSAGTGPTAPSNRVLKRAVRRKK